MWYERAYNYGRGLVIVLYILVVLGIGQHSPQYLETVDNALRIFIGIVLVALFNPWTHTSFNQFHRKIVFTSGLMLLLSSSLGSYVQSIAHMPHKN
jgi:hypothetical protein